MLHIVGLIPLLPLLAFAILAVFGARCSSRTIALGGTLPVAASAILALGVTVSFLVAPPAGHSFTQNLWTWFHIGSFAPSIALYLDPLSVLMVLVVAVVGLLILVYSTDHMRGDEGYRRFFAYMNLFIASMFILLLANDLLFLLVGWEGVGLSSYLLIGFWYRDPANGAAARKAFIVTRLGDTALLVALLLVATRIGSLDIQHAMSVAQSQWVPGSAIATAVALLILGGAIGKSAQLPLQTWLPDAMAGPTPVSALIHAATMVTAGVYLVARTHIFFELAPAAQTSVAIVGAATLIYGGLCALAQTDIKRVLAYSTISQIGYMFLALGVGAWSAAIFHFMTHAFFKALLFLAAGLVINALNDEHDIRRMGGLRRDLPVVFWTFIIGAASLAAVPLVTAGFFSKDLIIESAQASGRGTTWLWVIAVVGAFITSVYSFRLVFLVFFGERRTAPQTRRSSRAAAIPVVVLSVLAIAGGWMQLPRGWGVSLFTDFMQPVWPSQAAVSGGFAQGAVAQILVAAVSLSGIWVAYLLYAGRPAWARALLGSGWVGYLAKAGHSGLGFDRTYRWLIVKPFMWLAVKGARDVVDQAMSGVAWVARSLNQVVSRTQNGWVRYYLAAVSIGALVLIALGLLR